MKIKTPLKCLLYLAVWLLFAVGVKVLADNVLESFILHALYIMMILPIVTIVVTFFYAKYNGVKLWFIGYLLAAVLVLYFGFGYKSISPDFIVVNVISALFGFGFGSIFKDEAKIAAQEEFDSRRRAEKLKEEQNYTKILDEKPKGKRQQDKEKDK